MRIAPLDEPDFGFPDEEAIAHEWLDRCKLWRQAFWLIATKPNGGDMTPCIAGSWRRFGWQAGCLVAMLLGRSGFDDGARGDRAYYHSVEMGWMNHTQLYAGWRADIVSFHPRQFRYEIESDGDWEM